MDRPSYEMISVIGNSVTTVVAGQTFPELQRVRRSRSDFGRGRCTISEIPAATNASAPISSADAVSGEAKLCEGHCQLSRPWYARWFGGAAARVGRSFARYCAARSKRAGPQRGALGLLS
jgi:hypothetical protein